MKPNLYRYRCLALTGLMVFLTGASAAGDAVRGLEASVEAAGGSRQIAFRAHRPLSEGGRTEFWYTAVVTGTKASGMCSISGEVQYKPGGVPAPMEIALPGTRFDFVPLEAWSGDCALMEQTAVARTDAAAGRLMERVVFGKAVGLSPKVVSSEEAAESRTSPGVLLPPLPAPPKRPPASTSWTGVPKAQSKETSQAAPAKQVEPGGGATVEPSAVAKKQAVAVKLGAPAVVAEAEPEPKTKTEGPEESSAIVPPPPLRTVVLKPKKFCGPEDATGIAYTRYEATIYSLADFRSAVVEKPEPGLPQLVGCSKRDGWRAVYPTTGGASVIGWIRDGSLETQSLSRRE